MSLVTLQVKVVMILRTALLLSLLLEGVLAHNTLLVDHISSSSHQSPFHLSNATASIVNSGLVPHDGRTFFSISDMSGLSLVSISLLGYSHIPAIVDGSGHVVMTTLVVPSDTSIDTLYHSSGIDSTIALKSSEISDMLYSGSGGTLVSSGYIERQEMIGCSFTNVSRPSMTSLSMSTIAEECIMTGTTMTDTEDTFYNYIVCRLIITSRLSLSLYYYYSLHLIYTTTTTTTSLAAPSCYSTTSGGASVT